MTRPAPWHLQLLGSATLSGPGLDTWRLERKMAACLAYLTLEGATYRSRLVGLLWPESPEATARNNLSQLLRKLRLTTGVDLLGSGDPLVLPPEVEVDAARLRELYAQGRHAPLLELPGELLAGLHYDDCPELDDWVLSERERLNEWRKSALREEGARLEQGGAYPEALDLARRLLDLDPVSEEAWRRLMRLEYLRGDRPAALRAYQRCAEVLEREFGSRPLPETAALAREIERGTLPEVGPAVPRRELPLSVLRPPSLVGREREWARMEAAWAAGRWIYLRGDPGTGKTRLALDFAASKGGTALLSGRPGDAAVPFASSARNARSTLARWPELPIAPWVRRELARLVPELAQDGSRPPAALSSDADVLRLRQAMQVFFIERLGQLPSLVLDDWQYYDDTSNQDGVYMWFTPPPADVTGAMPRPIVTYRRGEVAPESEQRVVELAQLGLAEIIDVEPLTGADLDSLMNDVGVPAVSAVRERLLAYTGGNPLFLLETVKHLIETDQLSDDLPQQLPLPDRVWQLIERRLERLSAPALQAARAAATLQRDFDVALVADVLGAPLLDVAAVWEELESAQIVRGHGFWHDLISEAVAGSTPTSLRALLHRGAARALERAGANPARIAQHWLEAGSPAESIPALHAAEQHARATFQHDDAERFRLQREALAQRSGVIAPPSSPSPVPAGPLPATAEGFFGRDHDLQVLRSAVPGQPVVTLIGPGGVGKTRLAIETARTLAAAFPGGVVFVPLAGETDPDALLTLVARALGVTDSGGGLQPAVLAVLGSRQTLLILDNFEQLTGAAGAVAALLAGAPDLRVLVTSRSPLRITGERLYPVEPLTLPGTDAPDDHPAAALFVARARAMRPDFALTPENRGSVFGIIRRLDGLPLALELAAPRLRALSPAALLARLDRALPLLSQGARDLPERQRALRATIAWSDELLPPADRELFRRLAVFHGGWTLEAAEAIMDAPDELDVLEALSTLIDHSLVRVLEVPGGEPRYDMLSTIREYALEQLVESGQEDAARERHAAFLLALARRAQVALATPQQARWVEEVTAETPNLRSAGSWLLERGRLDEAAELGWRVAVYAWIGGRMVDAQAAALAILAHPDAAAQNHVTLGRAHGTLGIMRLWLYERQDAADALERAVAHFEAAGERDGAALSTVFLSLALTQLGDTERAGELARSNVEAARSVDAFVLALAYSANGFQAMARRDPQGIVEWYTQVVALAGPRGDHLNALHGHAVLAIAAIMGGQHAHAAGSLDEAQQHAQAIGYLNGLAMILEAHTLLRLQQGDLPAGATLYGASQALREQISTPNWDEGPLPPAQTEAMLAGALGAQEFERLRAQGRAMDARAALAWIRACHVASV